MEEHFFETPPERTGNLQVDFAALWDWAWRTSEKLTLLTQPHRQTEGQNRSTVPL